MRPRMSVLLVSLFFLVLPCATRQAFAHCDTVDGPVVQSARLALESGDITPVLRWIRAEDEPEVREAFARAVTVRKGGVEARELADRFFFEAVVRIHRAGEGAPYDGLKPAGSVEPVVAAADHAIETGSVDELANEISVAVRDAIRERFQVVAETRKHADENVAAGRAFVAAYVGFVHFVEAAHDMASASHAHRAEAAHQHDADR